MTEIKEESDRKNKEYIKELFNEILQEAVNKAFLDIEKEYDEAFENILNNKKIN